MNRVHPRPRLAEDWRFNKSFHILLFIWRGVRSAGAHAPRQGFCPRPCSCHSPSGPPPLSASGSIPTFCPAPSQPWGFSAPPPLPDSPHLAVPCLDFQETFQTRARPTARLAVLFTVSRQTPSLGCFEFSLWLLLLLLLLLRLLLQKYCVSSLNVLLIIGCL